MPGYRDSNKTRAYFDSLAKRAKTIKTEKDEDELKEDEDLGLKNKPRGKVVFGDKVKNDYMAPKKGRK